MQPIFGNRQAIFLGEWFQFYRQLKTPEQPVYPIAPISAVHGGDDLRMIQYLGKQGRLGRRYFQAIDKHPIAC